MTTSTLRATRAPAPSRSGDWRAREGRMPARGEVRAGEVPWRGRRVEAVYEPREPVDVGLTLGVLPRGTHDPTMWSNPATGDWWRVTRTPEGLATLVIRPTRHGARLVAFGDGAERAIASAPELLGRGDDWSGLDPRTLPPPLAEAWRRHPGLHLTRTGAVFESLAPAILEQKITTLEARRAWRYLHRRFAVAAPGPEGLVPRHLRAPLSPEEWRAIPVWEWHRAGVDLSRRSTLQRAAGAAAGLERTLELGRGSEEVTARLRSIPGVGVWTAAETTQRSHGDPDAPSFGDYHLAGHITWALSGEIGDDFAAAALLETWRGHRQRVVRLIGLARGGKPRRGPRMTVEDHRDR
ncbi:DNA-3-methyladenine glycosylase family protein [Pseudoclavibacter albus]|uniref:DNA-3-methyladenine glycosylase family protein n=1 Tax=Pseudoclavibacter albus TaxID=272241 RepID=UPI000AA8631F|nr:DNA-3-methyladenine glycosylase 2 family protein [Pseudoclavibacter alba]